MRIAIDMQGLQTGSRHRGIGRYTLSLVKAMIHNAKEHEIILLLNGLFPETIDPIITEFTRLLRPDQIKIWDALGPTAYVDSDNDWRRIAAEHLRLQRISKIAPDIIILTSLFEGYGDDFVATTAPDGSYCIPSATILYDLIPLLNPDEYLSDARIRQWYELHVDKLRKSNLLLAISESSRAEAIELLNYPPSKIINISSAVDDYFRPVLINADEERLVRERFGLRKDFLMYSGATDPRKNHIRLIQAYASLPCHIRDAHQLAIVGGMPDDHKAIFEAEAKRCGLNDHDCRIIGRVDDESLINLYNLCKGYIFPSWHEGFGLPALEAIKCGRPVIASNTTSLPEVIGDSNALFDPFNVADIAAKIERLLTDQAFRNELVEAQRKHSENFSWDSTANRVFTAIEQFITQSNTKAETLAHKEPGGGYRDLGFKLSQHAQSISESQLRLLSILIASGEQRHTERELLVDISELVTRDAHTGIQRVTKAILEKLTSAKLRDLRARPVCASVTRSYHYVEYRQECSDGPRYVIGGPVRAEPGDIFLGLDLVHPQVLKSQKPVLEAYRHRGVRIFFVVYDLIPLRYPQYTDAGVPEGHALWLDIVTESDGAVCISETVAGEVSDWLKANKPHKINSYTVASFKLGSDICESFATAGEPTQNIAVESAMKLRQTFLMVGTLEPRKGHLQSIRGFELLWRNGFDANLVIIGKPGWKIDELSKEIQHSRELGKRLFWIKDASDQYLQKMYLASTALLGASYCEGYGLPLVEAARHNLPLILRDIPIFREVVDNSAYYFPDQSEPEVIRDAIVDWSKKRQHNLHPLSGGIRCPTWEQSADHLLSIIGATG